MPSIRKLSDALITKIAAGEVIERPMSVVKELVENAIDAGAKNIQIDVHEGGRQEIRVVDDGAGMTREEVLLAIQRHATSKLKSEEDLFKISTLGFRGEALPSIASISLMILETMPSTGKACLAPTEEGTRVEMEGGKVLKTVSCARNQGTTIVIRNLFFNTPARLKFMKSRATEVGHISKWVESVALSHPEVGFTLCHGSGKLGTLKREFQSPPRTSSRERVRDLFGKEIEASLKPISSSRTGFELCGFVSDHQTTSSTSKSLYFFVNGRIVRDRTMQHAVLFAYENLLMKHRYPWVFLYLTVPTDFVDVNVHPTKAEVKFAQTQVVHEMVRRAVRDSLSAGTAEEATGIASGFSGTRSNLEADASGRGGPILRIPSPASGGTKGVLSLRSDMSSNPSATPVASSIGLIRNSVAPQDSFLKGSVRVLGQVHETYLLCETPDKLILIDQHAAHERIGFEKLKKEFEEGGVHSQNLLIPKTFEVKPSEAEILKLYFEDLQKFGLELEPFGNSSFILRSVPVLLARTDCVKLIMDLIDSFQSEGKLSPLQEKVHHVLETMACHKQVRAGDRLNNEEIQALIGEMEKTNFSYSCPHGRPSILQVPFNEVEKLFKRRL